MSKIIARLFVAGILCVTLTGCSISKKGGDDCCDDCKMDKNGKAVVQNQAKPAMGSATRPSTMPSR